MATSGRGWLAGATAGLVLVSACSTSAPAPAPGPTTVLATPAASSQPVEPPAGPGCRVELPAQWQQALQPVAHEPGETIDVQLVTPDGTTFLVSQVGGGHHEFQWRRGAESGLIQDFGGHPEWQVLAPSFDGRYVAYRVDHSFSNFEDFSLYVWDTTTRTAPVEIAHGEKDRRGDLMRTPFVDPVVHDGWVYWSQTRDQDPAHTVLSAYQISDGHREELSRGYGGVPVRFGDDLVWSDADRPGVTTAFRMVDLTTREPVTLPTALAHVRGASYAAGDDATLAWVDGKESDQVWVYRRGWPSAHLLIKGADQAEFPELAGDVVVLTQSDAVYAADLRSWSFAQVTPEYGSISADGGPYVNVGFAPTGKDSGSEQAVIDLRTVPALGRVGC